MSVYKKFKDKKVKIRIPLPNQSEKIFRVKTKYKREKFKLKDYNFLDNLD